jgi:hypothetical protein
MKTRQVEPLGSSPSRSLVPAQWILLCAVCVLWLTGAGPSRAATPTPKAASPTAVSAGAGGASTDEARTASSEQDANVVASLPAGAQAAAAAVDPTIEGRCSPMMGEIDSLLAAQREELTALQERFDRAANEVDALELQRAIERLKMQTEASILRTQARYARLAGQLRVAQEIEATLESLSEPAQPAPPNDRFAPVQSDVSNHAQR